MSVVCVSTEKDGANHAGNPSADGEGGDDNDRSAALVEDGEGRKDEAEEGSEA